MGDGVDFLSADKHKSFLQVDSITLGVSSQANISNQNIKFGISFQYCQGKCEG